MKHLTAHKIFCTSLAATEAGLEIPPFKPALNLLLALSNIKPVRT